MEGIIVSFRRGRRTQNTRQMIIQVDSHSTKEDALKLVGKIVEWRTPGKEKKVIKGQITSTHGRKGAVRALFETGIPGQALGTRVEIA